MLTLYHNVTFLNVTALKRPSSGCTDTFCEHGYQNTCPDVSIRLNGSLHYDTQQFDNRYVT